MRAGSSTPRPLSVGAGPKRGLGQRRDVARDAVEVPTDVAPDATEVPLELAAVPPHGALPPGPAPAPPALPLGPRALDAPLDPGAGGGSPTAARPQGRSGPAL